MNEPTLPVAFVCRLAADIMARHAERLDHIPAGRRAQPSVIAGRKEMARAVRSGAGKLYSLGAWLHSQPSRPFDAMAAGLLLAYAGGHHDALADLEDRLEALGHPHLKEILACKGTEVARLIEWVLT